MRMSWPRSRRWVAKEWRKVWQVTRCRGRLLEPHSSPRHRALHDALVEVMAALETTRLFPSRARREDPLPAPRFRCGGNLALDGLGRPFRPAAVMARTHRFVHLIEEFPFCRPCAEAPSVSRQVLEITNAGSGCAVAISGRWCSRSPPRQRHPHRGLACAPAARLDAHARTDAATLLRRPAPARRGFGLHRGGEDERDDLGVNRPKPRCA